MKLAGLDRQVIGKIGRMRYDRIIEKHEGPERWQSLLEHGRPDFLPVDGKWVLLPVEQAHHKNITILRSFEDRQGQMLTLFLKDTTWTTRPQDEWFSAGFAAICQKPADEDFYVAILYHEWFIMEETLA